MADGMQAPSVEGRFEIEMSPEIGDLAKDLPKAQAALGPVFKNATNPHFKSKYAGLDAVVEAVLPPLNANGFAVIQHPTGNGALVKVTTMLVHTSGQWMRSTLPLRPVKNDPQGVGSAITYGRRYGLMALAGVAPEDDDGNAASQQQKGKKIPNASVGPLDAGGKNNKELRAEFDRMDRPLEMCSTEQDLTDWHEMFGDAIGELPEDMQESLRGKYRRKLNAAKAVAA